MVVTVNNIAYDLKHGLKTDIYYPNDTDSETKILIFWHGGGWFRGSKDSVRDVGIDLANAGFMTFIPDYRLAPQHHFPAAHDDALNFAAWLLASDYTDAGDENNIVQIGASSGGTLALKVAGMYGFPTVTWSAPVDFSNWLASHQQVKASVNAKEEFGLVKQQAINDAFYKYFTLTYAGSDDSDVLEELDAQNYDYTKLNRLLLINSAAELTDLAGVSDFAARLAGRGHQVDLEIIPGHGHAMDYGRDYLRESMTYLNYALSFKTGSD